MSVQRCRTWDVIFQTQRWGHGPCTRLHHHLWNIPKGLDFHHLAFDKAIEFVKPHVGQVARWWDIQPRRNKGARVMAATAHPIIAMFGLSPCDDPITPFQIRDRR